MIEAASTLASQRFVRFLHSMDSTSEDDADSPEQVPLDESTLRLLAQSRALIRGARGGARRHMRRRRRKKKRPQLNPVPRSSNTNRPATGESVQSMSGRSVSFSPDVGDDSDRLRQSRIRDVQLERRRLQAEITAMEDIEGAAAAGSGTPEVAVGSVPASKTLSGDRRTHVPRGVARGSSARAGSSEPRRQRRRRRPARRRGPRHGRRGPTSVAASASSTAGAGASPAANVSAGAGEDHHAAGTEGLLQPLSGGGVGGTMGTRPQRRVPMAGAFADREWENEIAKNILTLYRADIQRQEIEQESGDVVDPEEAAAEAALVAADSAAIGGNAAAVVAKVARRIRAHLKKYHLTFTAVFKNFDKNVDGSVDVDEMRNGIKSAVGLELSKKDATALFGRFDADGSGDISVDELLQEFNRVIQVLPPEKEPPGKRGSRKGKKQPKNKRKQGGSSEQLFTASELAMMGQKHFVPHQIWFAGTGATSAEWGGLVSGDSRALTGELQTLEREGRYKKYVALVEGILTARSRMAALTELEIRQWRQLVVCCTIFGIKYTDSSKYGAALEMFQKAERLVNDGGGGAIEGAVRTQTRAFIHDALSYYYYKRKKPSAALVYATRSMKAHVRLEQWEHVAKCHLHTGAILSMLRRHDESIRCMGQVLQLVEDERLEVGGTSAQKICLVAVCYHNIAVEQLILCRVAEACVSSQNARRLARLSLSYSNRWLRQFESTHQACLKALTAQRDVRSTLKTQEQRELFQTLSRALYS